MMRRFIVFTVGRAGSALVADMLNSDPRITCDFALPGDARGCADDYLRARARHVAARAGSKAYGARLLVAHLKNNYAVPDIPSFVASLYDDGWKVIRLRRSTWARTIVSYLHADHEGFHLTASDGPWSYKPITVDPEELSCWKAKVGAWAVIEKESLKRVGFCDVIYERDLVTEADQEATMDRLSRWLIAEPASGIRTQYRRQMPTGPLSELIANYREVAGLLGDSAP